MSPLLEVTEDTPPDMLTGSMDLRLVLPDGKRVRMSIDRRTPMMDLLVQVTTAYKISPAGYVLQPYGETGLLPYKPSTPIGALDTWIVHIVPKTQSLQNPSNKINLKQVIPPFEQTFRFQVNLPRNQLYVSRVNGRCTMGDLLKQACSEKNLDPSKYTLRHPKNLDKPLCDELSVAEYGHNQVSMISHKSLPTAVSTEDILTKYKSLQSDSGSGSGSGSGASSVSPVRPILPSKPTRKRRPAPKPPVPHQQSTIQHQTKGDSMICHSRTSSDSSGYHEASVLSESPDSNNSSLPDSLPRRSKLPPAQNVVTKSVASSSKLSRSLSNLHQAVASTSGLKSAVSTSSLAPSRKKKPAPAPPVVAIVEEKEERSATLPPSARLLEHPPSSSLDHLPSPVDRVDPVGSPSTRLSPPRPTVSAILPVVPASLPVMSAATLPPQPRPRLRTAPPVPRPRSTAFEKTTGVLDHLEVIFKSMHPSDLKAELESARLDAEIERMFDQATREHVSLESGVELSRETSPDWTWEYRLPAPPTFRDDITSPSLTDYSTVGNLKQILFEPLDDIKDSVIEEENEEFVNNNNNNSKSINSCESSNSINLKDNDVELNLKNFNGETLQENNNEDVEVIKNVHIMPNIIIEPKDVRKISKTSEKIYVAPDKVNGFDTVDIKSTPTVQDLPQRSKLSTQKNVDSVGVSTSKKSVIVSNSNGVQNFPKDDNLKEKFMINVGSGCKIKEEDQIQKTVHKTRVERSDTVIQVVEQKGISQNVTKTSQQEASNTRSAILSELTTVINERGQKTNTITNKAMRFEQKKELVKKQERPQSMPLDNFCITTYSGSKPVEIYEESNEVSTKDRSWRDDAKLGSTKASGSAAVCRRSSARGDKRPTSPLRVRRSASVVTSLQRRLQHSRSNGNLLEEDEFPGRYFSSNLRKTTSELSINIDPDESKDILGKQETGLQSLQVLRSILPQLSQSQGALNTLETVNEKKDEFERPTISLTTWGERPKRQVSIKTDRDYVIGTKVQTLGIVPRPSPRPAQTTGNLLQQQTVREERKRTSVYKSIETGNTKPIRLNTADLGRLPVVRGVELKKNIQLNCSKEDLSNLSIHLVENKFQPTKEITDNRQLAGNKLFNRGRLAENNNIIIQNTTNNSNNNKKEIVPNNCSTERKRSIEPVVQPIDRSVKRQLETPTPTPPPPCPKDSPPKYLFGCETRVKTRPPTLLPPKAQDPRDELLASIRSFGKSTLKKVHQQR